MISPSQPMVGDAFVVPWRSHVPCSIPIAATVRDLIHLYSGRPCHLVSMAPIDAEPTEALLLQLYVSASNQLEPEHDRAESLLVVSPELGASHLLLRSWVFTVGAHWNAHSEENVFPVTVDPPEFFEGVYGVFHQFVRSSHLPGDEAALLNGVLKERRLDLESLYDSIGLSFAQLGGFPLARAAWVQILNEINPSSESAMVNVGQSYADDGLPEEAEDWLTAALERIHEDKFRLLGHFNRGAARLSLANPKAALDDFAICIQVDPRFGMAHANAGICRAELGDRIGAIESFEECLQLNEDSSRELGDSKQLAREQLVSLMQD